MKTRWASAWKPNSCSAKHVKAVLLFLSIVLSGCTAKYDYVAETKVDGAIVRVGLKHMHPVMAEFKRFLEIERAGHVEKKEIFPDTGGYAWVVLADDHGGLEIKDIGGVQYSGPKTTSNSKRQYLGRFDFDAKKVYRFIPAFSDPREPQAPR